MTKTYQPYSRSPYSEGGINIQIELFQQCDKCSYGHKQTVMGKEKQTRLTPEGKKGQ